MTVQAIRNYQSRVQQLIRYSGSHNESALRNAFHTLLDQYASGRKLLVVPEVEYRRSRRGSRVVPDGTLKDVLRQDWGYWESKDEKDDLDEEIAAKFAKGYPDSNILFEDTRTAVLYQGGREVGRTSFTDVAALDALLIRFTSYEPREVTEFHVAIKQFVADVPALAEELRNIIDEQLAASTGFKESLEQFLELCQHAINPRVGMADAREMLIQHILTEDIFMTVFDDPQFHRENAIARKLQDVTAPLYRGATLRRIHDRIAPYYEAINARAAQIFDHHEKQKFLKALYENFYRAYNPKKADRLGINYTPDEIVCFQIEGADHLLGLHFDRTLGDNNVEILDPSVGTGTYVAELIDYLSPEQLRYKYQHEIHCNEVEILPYYIANLNIEYTYKQKMGEYLPFDNICFVDTLDNLGFESSTEQQGLFSLTDENTERIRRQNARKISVVMGNPPYNANQLNENENNKNRPYPEIDRRIKETYIRHSSAQKTKLYDMYARFLRWASDRLAKNGIIAFVSNSSFLDARSYDGFRKVVEEEFNEIYILNLKGDARTSGERRRREGGNVFSDQIRVGIAIYFLVRREGQRGCHIHYAEVPDYLTATEKKAFLRENSLAELKFRTITPDKDHNWLNLAESDWDDLISLTSKQSGRTGERLALETIFELCTPGVSTNRDEWVYDTDKVNLAQKVTRFIETFNQQIADLRATNPTDLDAFVTQSIKWSEALKRSLLQGHKLTFNAAFVVESNYRPFFYQHYYAEKTLSDRLTANHWAMFGRKLDQGNLVVAFTNYGTDRPFVALATNRLPDLHLVGDSQCVSLYRYAGDGERVDNISDWAVKQFQQRYPGQAAHMTKQAIFHYVYAVLHHPAYRTKYAQNLKREFPRIPFYDDFCQWARWGERLMKLHLGYEQVEPYPLTRQDRIPRSYEDQSGQQSLLPTPAESDPMLPGIQARASSRVEKAKTRLIARKDTGTIEIDSFTTLKGVPAEAWEYRLGTYSALEWVLERYKERTPKDPTIRDRFNTYRFEDHKEQVIELIQRVCTVSVETMRIMAEMPDK